MYLRPAPNCGARLCTNLSPFPEQRATSQPDSTFLSLPYSLALIPQQLVYFWPYKHCTICLRLFLLQLHLSGAASALGKLSCEETTTPWGFKPFENTHAESTSSNRHFYILAPLLLLFLVSDVMYSFCMGPSTHPAGCCYVSQGDM